MQEAPRSNRGGALDVILFCIFLLRSQLFKPPVNLFRLQADLLRSQAESGGLPFV